MSYTLTCIGCGGKKFVNYVKLYLGEKFTNDTPTTIQKCLKCKGTGVLYGKYTKD